MLNFISVQHLVPNPETDGTQAPSNVRAQPAQSESYTDITEEDPDAGYLGDDEESDDDAPFTQVSTCSFIFVGLGNWQSVMKERKAN